MTSAQATDWRQLVDWSFAHGIAICDSQLDQLRSYLDVLLLWNRKIALVSQSDPKQIISKHFADSLFVASRCPDEGRIVDLGSGAGFPGLPIAIARPKARVCLIESRGKKASFLEHASQVTAARNAEILHRRIESVAHEDGFRASFVVATGRALTSATQFFALAGTFLGPGGQTIAMRSLESWPLPPDIEEIRYTLPDGSPRRLLIARP